MLGGIFVCLGNICRSPSAEGVFRCLVRSEGLADLITTDSAGIGAWHIGDPPDDRAQAAALRRGVNLSDLRARQFKAADFERFDYILAMGEANRRDMAHLSRSGLDDRLKLFLDFAPQLDRREVPDPYYGGDSGFDEVLNMIEAASHGLLDDIRRNHL